MAYINLGEIKLQKKLIVILITLGLLISGISAVSAVNVRNYNFFKPEESPSVKDVKTLTVTLFKHEFDGSKTPIDVKIELEEGKDIVAEIEKKCYEILENDPKIQSLLENNETNDTQQFIQKIKSRGKGLHFRFNTRIQLFKLYKIFPLLPPYFRTFIILPIVICQYKKDNKAYTTLTSINGSNSTTIVGPHRVISIGFYGISWWIGKFSLYGFIFRNGFVGISLLTRIKKLDSS